MPFPNLRADSPARDDNQISFPFDEYNEQADQYHQVLAANPAVSKRPRPADAHYAAIKAKVDALEKSVHRRIDKLQGSVNYVAKCVEDFNENFASIMNVVKDNQVRAVADTLPFETSFPLTTKEEVDEYVESDPKAIKLTERYVSYRLNILHWIRRVSNMNYL